MKLKRCLCGGKVKYEAYPLDPYVYEARYICKKCGKTTYWRMGNEIYNLKKEWNDLQIIKKKVNYLPPISRPMLLRSKKMYEPELVEVRNLYIDNKTGKYYFNTAYEEMIGPFLTLDQANNQLQEHYHELEKHE